jgi:hypothetical protein
MALNAKAYSILMDLRATLDAAQVALLTGRDRDAADGLLGIIAGATLARRELRAGLRAAPGPPSSPMGSAVSDDGPPCVVRDPAPMTFAEDSGSTD